MADKHQIYKINALIDSTNDEIDRMTNKLRSILGSPPTTSAQFSTFNEKMRSPDICTKTSINHSERFRRVMQEASGVRMSYSQKPNSVDLQNCSTQKQFRPADKYDNLKYQKSHLENHLPCMTVFDLKVSTLDQKSDKDYRKIEQAYLKNIPHFTSHSPLARNLADEFTNKTEAVSTRKDFYKVSSNLNSKQSKKTKGLSKPHSQIRETIMVIPFDMKRNNAELRDLVWNSKKYLGGKKAKSKINENDHNTNKASLFSPNIQSKKLILNFKNDEKYFVLTRKDEECLKKKVGGSVKKISTKKTSQLVSYSNLHQKLDSYLRS
jgi:hypothetical protein